MKNIVLVFKKITHNPYYKLLIGLIIVVANVYDIVEDIMEIKKEHGLIIIGILLIIDAAYGVYDGFNDLRDVISEGKNKLKSDA